MLKLEELILRRKTLGKRRFQGRFLLCPFSRCLLVLENTFSRNMARYARRGETTELQISLEAATGFASSFSIDFFVEFFWSGVVLRNYLRLLLCSFGFFVLASNFKTSVRRCISLTSCSRVMPRRSEMLVNRKLDSISMICWSFIGSHLKGFMNFSEVNNFIY